MDDRGTQRRIQRMRLAADSGLRRRVWFLTAWFVITVPVLLLAGLVITRYYQVTHGDPAATPTALLLSGTPSTADRRLGAPGVRAVAWSGGEDSPFGAAVMTHTSGEGRSARVSRVWFLWDYATTRPSGAVPTTWAGRRYWAVGTAPTQSGWGRTDAMEVFGTRCLSASGFTYCSGKLAVAYRLAAPSDPPRLVGIGPYRDHRLTIRAVDVLTASNRVDVCAFYGCS